MKTTNLQNMRRLLVMVSATALFLATFMGTALAKGPDPDRLASAGWFCFGHAGPATHCIPDGDAVFTGAAKASLIMTWDSQTGEFWGTELLVHEDIYKGQPCPQDLVNGEPSTYIHLTELGLELPYLVCHHFESPLT